MTHPPFPFVHSVALAVLLGSLPVSAEPAPVAGHPSSSDQQASDATAARAVQSEYATAKADYDALRAGRPAPSGETDHMAIEKRYYKAYEAYIKAMGGR